MITSFACECKDDKRNQAKKGKQKDSPAHVFAQRLLDFLELLEDMENKKETMRTVSGELEGPFDSKAVYGYTVKLGIGGPFFENRFQSNSAARKKNKVR